VWAYEFAKVAPSVDRGLMIAWFANCAENAKDLYRRAQPAPEPVPAGPDDMAIYKAIADNYAQPAAEPLTDKQIATAMLAVDDPLLWGRLGDGQGDMARQFARAIEAAHGIGKGTP
jgi:hypothetical protein